MSSLGNYINVGEFISVLERAKEVSEVKVRGWNDALMRNPTLDTSMLQPSSIIQVRLEDGYVADGFIDTATKDYVKVLVHRAEGDIRYVSYTAKYIAEGKVAIRIMEVETGYVDE